MEEEYVNMVAFISHETGRLFKIFYTRESMEKAISNINRCRKDSRFPEFTDEIADEMIRRMREEANGGWPDVFISAEEVGYVDPSRN